MEFNDVPNHEETTFEAEYYRTGREAVETREEAEASWEAIGDGSEGIVTTEMRQAHFNAEGYMTDDKTIWEWYKPTKTKLKVKRLPGSFTIGRQPKLIQDGGGGRNYYDLPPNPEQLLDLIEYRNMNGNIKDIFKACYRLGQKDGTSEEYDLRKMVLYSLRELGRITGRKDYIDLAIEVAGHHDRIYANTH